MEERIDHMKYLPDMEQIDSDIPDRVIAEMNGYDPSSRSCRSTSSRVVPIATSIVRPAFSQMTGRVSDIFLFINRVKIQLFPNFDKRKLYL